MKDKDKKNKETECFQCMDKGLLIIPIQNENEMTYDYMFQCSCSKGNWFPQLPKINILVESNRELLKSLANRNYKIYVENAKDRINRVGQNK